MVQFRLQRVFYRISQLLEIMVGLLATFPIVLAIFGMVSKIFTFNYFEDGLLLAFIQQTIEIIIGIEFVKLIFIHTMDSTIEVIIMAIMRQIIVEHPSSLDTLALVTAICLLFLVRKFLFVRELDKIKFQNSPFFQKEISQDKKETEEKVLSKK